MKNTIQKTKFAAIAVVAAVVAFTSADTWAGGSHTGGHGTKGPFIGSPGKAKYVARTIEINMYDNYYEPTSINVKEGETIRFVVKNVGDFVHEFNIGTTTMHAQHQEEMMMMMEHGALEADKINHDMMKMDMGGGKTMQHDDPNSVLLEPGQNDEVIWRFSQTANLEFACNVPGHYESGMVGHIKIKH